MRTTLTGLLAGLLFGAGLALAGMTDPAVVIGFLDVAGAWNPALAVVMAGALAVTFVGYRLALSRGRPLFAPRFQLPTVQAIDRPLLVGAALFGAGWGLTGYCPGPAVASLAGGAPGTFVFVAAMLAGMAAVRRARAHPPAVPAPAA